jgi:hypothetical protein
MRSAKQGFSVLADEAADCGKLEQLSLIVCFVDETHRIREQFLGFLQCNRGLSGDAIATTIKDFLCDQNLPIDVRRGQGL